MVNKCAAFGCKSGYKSNRSVDLLNKVTLHVFPLGDKDLCDKWIRANPRKDFVPTKNSRLCSLHFRPSDFIEERLDKNVTRRKSVGSASRVLRRLKDDAVPSIFPNAPDYLSMPQKKPRKTSKATSSSRREVEASRLEQLQQSSTACDDISSLSLTDIAGKLQSETTAPAGFTVTLIDQSLLIYLLDTQTPVTKISAGIKIAQGLSVVVTLEDKVVPASQYSDLLKDEVRQMSQLLNLMARVKSWCNDSKSRTSKFCIAMAADVLEGCLESLDADGDLHRKVSFIVEQLHLMCRRKFGRHYSPQLTIMSFMVHASSASAYRVLRDESILCLPSVSTLKKVSRRLGGSSGIDNTAYLKMRISKLNNFQRSVVLIIDEIYIAKRVEYCGGSVLGLTAEGTVASTLLCFMIKSVAGKYKDLVAIYPMSKLSADKQNDCFKEVVQTLRSVDVNVVAISVDNASINRKFFTDCLCEGQLKTHVCDPVTGQPMFLIFDPVHDLKNVYNNFQSRVLFECPPMERNLPNGCTANFKDIVALFDYEADKPLKIACRLTPASLDPKNIEKTSVKLAVSVFCESTRNALNTYGDLEGKASWKCTANFISLILKLWNVMNVKTRFKGKHKRDITMDPVRSSLDWKLCFLREFADFLSRWEQSKKPGLTRETFLALRQTCLALADCAAYLLDRLGFNFVLLGHLQSDAIESRFGWLRQLSGANYYISMRQVMESDKKIRALSVVKFSGFSLSEIDTMVSQSDSTVTAESSTDETMAEAICQSLTYRWQPSSTEANITYYVSGYIGRSIVHSVRCEHCRSLLIEPEQLEPLELDETLDIQSSTLLDSINRGGLSKPTEYTFMTVISCWRVFHEIKISPQLTSKLLAAKSQRSLFIAVMTCATTEDGDLLAADNFCAKNHSLKPLIAQRFFNCVAKNLVRELTQKANKSSAASSRKRKIAKLQSAAHQ